MTFRSSSLALVLTALTCAVPMLLASPPAYFTTSAAPNSTPPGPSPDRASGLPPPDHSQARPARFGWPLAPPHPVVRPFQPPSTPYGPGHRGVDLGGQPNSPVLTAGDGVVAFAGPLAGRGVVSIDHAGGIRTTYEPLAVLIPAGMRVTRGTVIGHLTPGHSGCVDAPACLHWGARRGTEYLDPLGLLSTGRIRLLPWPDGGDPAGGG